VRPTTLARGACLLACAILLAMAPSAWALPQPTVKLSVSLTPEKLGGGTTIGFDFTVHTPPGHAPSPLVGLDLLYPANIGVITSGLGLTNCERSVLEASGPAGCPANSQMGQGSALVEIPIGPKTIIETGLVTTWMGPIQNGHLGLLFYAYGEAPVLAQLIFPSMVVNARAPFGGSLNTQIPVIPSLPEAPDLAIVQMSFDIGPRNITYYKQEHGQTIAYQPNGVRLPRSCPRGGFPFAASFAFLDGAHTTAHTKVACPRRG
jgi:hypothetical protein